MTQQSDRSCASQQPKKTYRAPTLASYGPVERLTQGSSGTRTDGGAMPHM